MANLVNFLVTSAIKQPSGLWPTIFKWIESFISGYGWTIVFFTLFVKVIMLPFDFYNRYLSRKNNFIQKRLSGEVKKINDKFKNNREKANQAANVLYKREGYNMVGTCIFTLVNLILTLVVFMSFFNSLRDISAYKMLDQYQTLESTYIATVDSGHTTEEAQEAVLNQYNSEFKDKNRWLWVNNVWRNDSNTSKIPSYNQIQKTVNNAKDKKRYKVYFNEESEAYISEEQYNTVMKPIIESNKGWNGYYILALLAGGLTYLSQLLTKLQNKSKKEKDIRQPQNPTMQQTENTMKLLTFILPAIMVIFALTSTAAFSIYLVTSSLFGIASNYGLGFIVAKMTKKEEEKYLAYIEKQAIKQEKQEKQKPQMVTYKNIGDRL